MDQIEKLKKELQVTKQKLKTVRKQFREYKREQEPTSNCCDAGFYTDAEGGRFCGSCDGDGRVPYDHNEGCAGANCDDYTCNLCDY